MRNPYRSQSRGHKCFARPVTAAVAAVNTRGSVMVQFMPCYFVLFGKLSRHDERRRARHRHLLVLLYVQCASKHETPRLYHSMRLIRQPIGTRSTIEYNCGHLSADDQSILQTSPVTVCGLANCPILNEDKSPAHTSMRNESPVGCGTPLTRPFVRQLLVVEARVAARRGCFVGAR